MGIDLKQFTPAMEEAFQSFMEGGEYWDSEYRDDEEDMSLDTLLHRRSLSATSPQWSGCSITDELVELFKEITSINDDVLWYSDQLDYESYSAGLWFVTGTEQEALDKINRCKAVSDGYGLTELSDATAESLSKQEGFIKLNGLTSLSDAAAESLSKHKGNLWLNGLTSLSDAAAASLSKHEGDLDLYGLTNLSDGPGHISLAEQLSKHERESLNLSGLTCLSDAAAESLSKHEGSLSLDGLTELSDAAAESLSKHAGGLYLHGLASLSDAAAESLSKHQGECLSLCGLSSLSDAAAKSLSECQHVNIAFDNLPASAAKILRGAGHGDDDDD